MDMLVLVKGAGDLATGAAHKLHRCGFKVVMTEIPQPTVIRRTVSFAEAVYEGVQVVDGATARLVKSEVDAKAVLENSEIPVLIDPTAERSLRLKPDVVVDAVIAKQNTGTRIDDAPLVIALGPGFKAGQDAHAVVETQRGHDLGKVILDGCALPNTSVPGMIGGYARERLVRAPADGVFEPTAEIGSHVTQGQIVGYVGCNPVKVEIPGVLRGLLRDGLRVSKGMKIGDVDPRDHVEHCYSISDKARCIAGGVLEAVLWLGKKNGTI